MKNFKNYFKSDSNLQKLMQEDIKEEKPQPYIAPWFKTYKQAKEDAKKSLAASQSLASMSGVSDIDEKPVEHPIVAPQTPIPPKKWKWRPFDNFWWIVPGMIMRANRPGYGLQGLGKNIVNLWLTRLENTLGELPKTIVCLLSQRELSMFYKFNLLSEYRKRGFNIHWMPTRDPIYNASFHLGEMTPFNSDELDTIYKWCEEGPAPILIHCSAGIDRTGFVSEYLKFVYGIQPSIPKGTSSAKQSAQVFGYAGDDDDDEDDDEDYDEYFPQPSKSQIDKFNKKFGGVWVPGIQKPSDRAKRLKDK